MMYIIYTNYFMSFCNSRFIESSEITVEVVAKVRKLPWWGFKEKDILTLVITFVSMSLNMYFMHAQL